MKGNKIMELVLFWFVLSILVGVFANNRGKSDILYFLFSIILSPLLGFLIALISGDDSKKKCSNCGQKIDINAKVCPFCLDNKGEKKINENNENDIEKYIGISKEYNVFELQAAIAKKDVAKALKIIQYFDKP